MQVTQDGVKVFNVDRDGFSEEDEDVQAGVVHVDDRGQKIVMALGPVIQAASQVVAQTLVRGRQVQGQDIVFKQRQENGTYPVEHWGFQVQRYGNVPDVQTAAQQNVLQIQGSSGISSLLSATLPLEMAIMMQCAVRRLCLTVSGTIT